MNTRRMPRLPQAMRSPVANGAAAAASPPSPEIAKIVIDRVLASRRDLDIPSRRALEAVVDVEGFVRGFRKGFEAPTPLVVAVTCLPTARARAAWGAFCVAFASLEVDALDAVIAATPDPTTADGDAPAPESDAAAHDGPVAAATDGADTDLDLPTADGAPSADADGAIDPAVDGDAAADPVVVACRVAVEILTRQGACDLVARVRTAAAPVPVDDVAADATVADAARVTQREAKVRRREGRRVRRDAEAPTVDTSVRHECLGGDVVGDPTGTADGALTAADACAAVVVDEVIAPERLDAVLRGVADARDALGEVGIRLPVGFAIDRCHVVDARRAARSGEALLATLAGGDGAPRPKVRSAITRQYNEFRAAVQVGRDPQARVKRARGTAPTPQIDLNQIIASVTPLARTTRRATPVEVGANANGSGGADGCPAAVVDVEAPTDLEEARRRPRPMRSVVEVPTPVSPAIEIVRSLLQAGEFYGAAVALQMADVVDRPAITALVEAMQARLNLDFERAARRAQAASRHFADPSAPMAVAAMEMANECARGAPLGSADDTGYDAFGTDQQAAAAVRIVDIYWQAQLCAARDEHVEMVARVTGAIDTAVRWLVGREFGIDLLKDDRGADELWQAMHERRPHVCDVALKVAAHTFPRVTEDTFRYIEGLVAVIRGIAADLQGKDKARAGRLRRVATRIEDLRDVRELRHRSFFGHRPNRVSAADLGRALTRRATGTPMPFIDWTKHRPQDRVLDLVGQLLRDMGLPIGSVNPLRAWGERIAGLVAPVGDAQPLVPVGA